MTQLLIDALGLGVSGALIAAYGWFMYQAGKSEGELKVSLEHFEKLLAKTKKDTAVLQESNER